VTNLPPGSNVPLCVDLDGTLVFTNMLLETLVRAVARNPLVVFLLPVWLAGGRANLKSRLAQRGEFDAATLPYNARLLEELRTHRAQGRRIVLATASDAVVANRIAAHLGVFDEVIASDGTLNVRGQAKAEALAQRFGAKGFDYVGDSDVDKPVWERARDGLRVAPPRPANRFLRALRLHQWTKNLLVFVPLFTAHGLGDPVAVRAAFLAFVAFSLAASAIYIVNDLSDLDADRSHPLKRRRVFAAGELSIGWGLAAVPVLLAASALIASALPPLFAAELAIYVAATFAYSIWLKPIALLDAFVLAGLYSIRILAGAAAVQVPLSHWLLAFSLFMFLSLALAKRHAELSALAGRDGDAARGRGYRASDRDIVGMLGCASGFASIIVFALYITSGDMLALYANPRWLWMILPLMLYWISRVWLLAHRGQLDEDPVLFAVRDPVSLAVAVLTVACVAVAT
jgi:4-hydroxybenzoate polyprenyltransferase